MHARGSLARRLLLCLVVAVVPLAQAATPTAGTGWRLLAEDREVAPPGPPGLTAVTAEASVQQGSRHRVLRFRVVAHPASLKPYVSWHVACPTGRRSFAGDGFHRSSFTKTIAGVPGCAADVTAILYFWAGASGVSVWIYGS
jgi:hypothetical protein